MTNLTTDQELRVIALQQAVQHCGEQSPNAGVRVAADIFYDFLVEGDKRKPLRIGDAHIRLVVDGGGQVIEGTVRDAVAECLSAEEAMHRREGAR